MNTYIKDKLLEKHICRFNDGECNCDCYIAGMQDYHNYIVEKINKELKSVIKKKEQITNDPFHPARCQYLGQQDALTFILSLLQDTNPKE